MKLDKFANINCNSNRAFFSNDPQRGYITLIKARLIKLIDFLIDNIYVKFGEVIMRQNIGIPMGTDCAPLLGDLFLHYHEFQFINKMMKDKSTYYLAKMFNNTFRYIKKTHKWQDYRDTEKKSSHKKYISNQTTKTASGICINAQLKPNHTRNPKNPNYTRRENA